MVGGVGGAGEAFSLQIENNPITPIGERYYIIFYLKCLGGESDLYLSHANAKISLSPNRQGGEVWYIDHKTNGNQNE